MKLRLGILLAMLVALALSAISVYAIGPPDSNPSVTNIKANRYLIEEGDVLIYGTYDIPYASVPDEPANDTYLFRILDDDEVIGTITPFSFFDKGHNKGVFAFYFSASDNIAWGESYTIRISQNPAFFDAPESWDYTVPSAAYTSQTVQILNRTELTINIISMAQYLETHRPAYTLLEDSAGGTILSSPTGETYFRGAIYGIQVMAPDLFLVQVMEIDVTAGEWTTTEFDEYPERFDETWTGNATAATSEQFGITPQMLMAIIFALPICIGAIIVSSMKFKKAEPGFVVSIVILTMAVLMGWLPGAIYAALLQCMAIYIAYVWFYARG